MCCIVCREWEAGKLSSKEALKNLGEMMGADKKSRHYLEVAEKILDKEVPLSDSDEELDKSWYQETYED